MWMRKKMLKCDYGCTSSQALRFPAASPEYLRLRLLLKMKLVRLRCASSKVTKCCDIRVFIWWTKSLCSISLIAKQLQWIMDSLVQILSRLDAMADQYIIIYNKQGVNVVTLECWNSKVLSPEKERNAFSALLDCFVKFMTLFLCFMPCV